MPNGELQSMVDSDGFQTGLNWFWRNVVWMLQTWWGRDMIKVLSEFQVFREEHPAMYTYLVRVTKYRCILLPKVRTYSHSMDIVKNTAAFILNLITCSFIWSWTQLRGAGQRQSNMHAQTVTTVFPASNKLLNRHWTELHWAKCISASARSTITTMPTWQERMHLKQRQRYGMTSGSKWSSTPTVFQI